MSASRSHRRPLWRAKQSAHVLPLLQKVGLCKQITEAVNLLFSGQAIVNALRSYNIWLYRLWFHIKSTSLTRQNPFLSTDLVLESEDRPAQRSIHVFTVIGSYSQADEKQRLQDAGSVCDGKGKFSMIAEYFTWTVAHSICSQESLCNKRIALSDSFLCDIAA